MHNYDFLVQTVQQRPIYTILLGIFPGSGKIADVQSLILDAEHIGHIAPVQGLPQIGFNGYAQRFYILGQQCFWAAKLNIGFMQFWGEYIEERYPGMKDIAYYYYILTAHLPQFLHYGKRIQQGLGRLFVGTIARIDNGRLYMVGQK